MLQRDYLVEDLLADAEGLPLIGNRAQYEGRYDRIEARVREGERAGRRVHDVDRHPGLAQFGGEPGPHGGGRLAGGHMVRGPVEGQVSSGASADLQNFPPNARHQLLT